MEKIPEIISECKKQSNMFVAVSNPCFEFWLLLHIKDIAEYTEEELNLMLKNGKVSSKKNYVDAKIVEILGAYNKVILSQSYFFQPLILLSNKQSN
jgi:hypothetical protein